MTAPRNPDDTRVNLAELATRRGAGTLTALALGSCVAIVLYDSVARVGGLAHVMLPDESMARVRGKPGKFPASAVDAMMVDMARLGAARERLGARLVGGASMFTSLIPAGGMMNIGQRNVEASRAALESAGIPILAEDVGSDYGRTVELNVADGCVVVRSIRAGRRVL